MLRAALLGGLLAACGGCSFSIAPLAPSPAETTGSIKKIEKRFSADLGQEDWRRAKGALILALDPQGNGKPVKWDNPETRVSGEVTPDGTPFVESDEVCRKFRATVELASGASTSVEGSACRLSAADDWEIKTIGSKRGS
jgi:surface antigen